MTEPTLSARGLSLHTPEGRPLVRGLRFAMGREQLALVGRNGVGKSTLLSVLAGAGASHGGQVQRSGRVVHVPQQLPQTDATSSPGERRRTLLKQALGCNADFLLLDEPTRDLDEASASWLLRELEGFRGGLLVATHDRHLLQHFRQFCVMEEAGCWPFSGSSCELLREIEQRSQLANRKYVAELARLDAHERRTEADIRRRERKKNGGRVRELDRRSARACLNAKRGYAQKSQARRAQLQQSRSEAARNWARAARRALSVELPLEALMPELPPVGEPLLRAADLAAQGDGGLPLFSDVSVRWLRQRWGLSGPNGVGKSTLLQVLSGDREPNAGSIQIAAERIGIVAQHAANWELRDSLLELLQRQLPPGGEQRAAEQLSSHRFPFALAERPLCSLSPGERTRAALICLMERRPVVEALVLDEPTDALDFAGVAALQRVLRAWPGGLLVVSHDPGFLRPLCTDGVFELRTSFRDLHLG